MEDIFSMGLLGQVKGFADKTFGVGGPLTKEDVYQIGVEAMATPDPDRDGINDGDEIVDEIKKEDEEELTPMQKYFKDIQSATKNDIGMSQMTPEEKLITSLGIQNRVIEPFEQWLATQEEAVRNLPKWLQSSKYREYAKNRTSSAQSYQPRTASMMASTEVIEDKSPATTELFNRLGMSNNIATAKGGGQILDNMVMRQTGGAAAPNFTTIAQPPGQLPLPYPDFRRPPPDFPVMPEPPPPPPEPKIIYDPVREAEAERRARELQARKIAELDEAPQTRAEREALQASGGFYRDDEGQVRDAMGNIQEDFGFDYVAPPEPGRPDPVNTPDTPKWEPPKVPEPIDTTPLPPGLARNPETGEITVDPEGAKKWRGGSYGWEYDDGAYQQVGSDWNPWRKFNEQDYLAAAYMEGYDVTGLGRGDLGGGWSIERTDPGLASGNPANSPGGYNYALKGPSKTFLPKPVTLPDIRTYQPMMGQQPQPTGLQGLQQGMQGFGMQSPRPFGQQPNFNTYSDILSANSYNPAMGIK
jgi:hypothetical protein